MFPGELDADVFQAEFEVFKNIVNSTPELLNQENTDVTQVMDLDFKQALAKWLFLPQLRHSFPQARQIAFHCCFPAQNVHDIFSKSFSPYL